MRIAKERLEYLEEMYNKKLEDALAQEREILMKEMDELVMVCENSVLSG